MFQDLEMCDKCNNLKLIGAHSVEFTVQSYFIKSCSELTTPVLNFVP